MSKKALVIEDDLSISKFMKILLGTDQYKVVIAKNGSEGILDFKSENPDVIILDMGLPDMDGMEVLKEIRQQSQIPIIVVSARNLTTDIVAVLDAGADDYMTKPFNTNELLARIRVALRRHDEPLIMEKVFEADALKIDFEKYKVYVDEEEVHFTPLEYKILVLLVENAGKVLTHDFIIERVWGHKDQQDTQSLRVFITNIRRKIEKNHVQYINTEVGIGYRFSF